MVHKPQKMKTELRFFSKLKNQNMSISEEKKLVWDKLKVLRKKEGLNGIFFKRKNNYCNNGNRCTML